MIKIVMAGAGRNYEKIREYYEKECCVIGVVDNAWKEMGDDIHSVEWITHLDYDVVVITPTRHDIYMSLLRQLLELGVAQERIMIDAYNPKRFAQYSLGCKYYGQHCDDLILSAIFSRLGIECPSYIDLGANHPYLYSNTALMYENGGRGINIDANRELIEVFNLARPQDVNLNFGVGKKAGELPFYMIDSTSGINSFLRQEIERFDAKITEIRKIPVITLGSILDEYCPNGFPDFLDCDIEGMDYEVLDGYDLEANGPKVLCVEVRSSEIGKFDEMLRMKRYFRFCRIGENNIYVRNEFSNDVMHLTI